MPGPTSNENSGRPVPETSRRDGPLAAAENRHAPAHQNDTAQSSGATTTPRDAGPRRPVRPYVPVLRRQHANLGEPNMTRSRYMRIHDPTAPASESEPKIVLELEAEVVHGVKFMTEESQQDFLERAEEQRRAIMHRSIQASSAVVRVLPDTAAQLTLELAAVNGMIELFSNATRLSVDTFVEEWTRLFQPDTARELGLRVKDLDLDRIAWLFHLGGYAGIESFGRRAGGNTDIRLPYRIQTVIDGPGIGSPAELEATPVQPRSGINGRFELAEVSTPRGRGPLTSESYRIQTVIDGHGIGSPAELEATPVQPRSGINRRFELAEVSTPRGRGPLIPEVAPVRATETSGQGNSIGEGPEGLE